MANRARYGLKKPLSSRYLGRLVTCDLYKAHVGPILAYVSESWPLKTKDENMIRPFERKIFRRIYGPNEENGIWRSRYNHENNKLYNESDQNMEVEMAGTTMDSLYSNGLVIK
jgi:hypothetical protein